MSEKILIIDDDKALSELITTFLKKHNFTVVSAAHPDKGLKLLFKKNQNFDMVILDIMLPGMDGFQVLRKIRENSTIPVVMLTARGEVSDRVVGLELGADDYLPKPFDPAELIARMQSIFRRTRRPSSMIDSLVFEHLSIDKLKQEVMLDGNVVQLSTTEFEALLLFAENAGEVLNRDYLVEHLRGIAWQSYDRSIDVLVSRLRNKLKTIADESEYIKTIHGVGYKFIDRLKKNK
jgi:DNA-binding response OmpR family regulator